MSTVPWQHAVSIPCTWDLQKPAWARRAWSHPALPWEWCCRKHWRHDSRSLTPAPGGDRTEEVASRNRFYNRWAFAASRLKSPRAGLRTDHQHLLPVDGRADSKLTSASRCQDGRADISASKK